MVSVRAVYHDGQLLLLEPTHLHDGQEVQIQIIEPTDQLGELIADMLFSSDHMAHEAAVDVEEIIQEQLDAALVGQRPLSEIIIEDRHDSE